MRRGSALDNFHGAVVIAVVAVRVVQAAIDEKVDVVAVRHGFVPGRELSWLSPSAWA